ncbi:MAG: SpoIIE family protein phosphatase [Acidobacteria bacterium]|nr:SpoIIE family protein phosphatase [Acidobacteriota bacterium]
MTVPAATILVVDDSPVNLQVLVRTLHGTGHRILAARDGASALEIARRARPELMLLDVMMPELDGFEVCRAIKSHPDTEDTVVIFLSARGEVADKVSGLQLGAVDYITKPIQAEEVLARVAAHLTRQFLERELRRNRDRLERELASAASMQRLILPATLPVHPSVRFAAFYQTSRHAGGDYYDILDLSGDRFGIIVADVSGHGARAAIVMAMIRAVIHTFPGIPDDPAAVLHYLNRHFRYLWETAMFATGLYGVLDVGRRTLRLACAGHPAPLRVHRDGRVEELPIDGVMALLWDEFGDVPCSEHALEAGDRVVFYTDGITDRLSTDGTLYDLERLRSSLAREGSSLPGAIVERIVLDLDAFAGGHEPDDDQTLLVVGVD